MLSVIPENCKSLNAVKYITSNKLFEMYTNMTVALKQPVSVTLVQSLFLRLKLMENYVLLMTRQWHFY
jgi:hypothetical protein